MLLPGLGSVVERLVGSPVVVVVDPSLDIHPGMFEGGEALRPAQLLLESLDGALIQAVLLRRAWLDVFLLQAVVADHRPALE